MRDAIAENDPAILLPSFAARCVGDVNGFVPADPSLPENRDRAIAGVIAENASGATRGIFPAAQRDEGDPADRDPQDVERGEPAGPSHKPIITTP